MNNSLEAVGVTDEWMQTFTGTKFTPLNPRPEDISLMDIAHALSLQCRYGGHCKVFYSVAQHSVMASHLCKEYARECLMHDASEAYLQDMIRPLKLSPLGELYLDYEDRLMRVLAKHFNFTYPFPPEVKQADNIMLFTEKRDIVNVQLPWYGEEDYKPLLLPDKIEPWAPARAELAFWRRFEDLWN